MWREEENICCEEVDAVKNKNLEAVAVEELPAEPRYIFQHPGVFQCMGSADSLTKVQATVWLVCL